MMLYEATPELTKEDRAALLMRLRRLLIDAEKKKQAFIQAEALANAAGIEVRDIFGLSLVAPFDLEAMILESQR